MGEMTSGDVLQAAAGAMASLRAENERLKALNAELVDLLVQVREACLFAEDDGAIGVTTDAHIPEILFQTILNAIAKSREPESEAS